MCAAIMQFQVDDLVLLKRMSLQGKHKLQDHWEKTIYRVEGQPYPGMPVFRIVSVEGEGMVKVVHQNLLLPIGTNKEDSKNEERQ